MGFWKKRICLFLGAGILCSQIGCAEKKPEQLYVSFYGIGSTTNAQNLDEILNPRWENSDFHELDALYISGTQFQQYFWEGTVLEGAVKSGEGGGLLMQYEDFTVPERSAGMPEDYKEEQENSFRQYMSDANRSGGLISMYPSGEFRIHPDAGGWSTGTYMMEWSTVPIVQKDGYLVTEQTGYSLKGADPAEDFALSCDGGGLEKETAQTEMLFSRDGTWTADGRSGGFWEIAEDAHLLAVYSGLETQDAEGLGVTLFYLDFQTGEVYIPLYLQYDKLLNEFHQQES